MDREGPITDAEIQAQMVANSPPFCVVMGTICGHLGAAFEPIDYFGQFLVIECATCGIVQYARVIAS